MKYTLLYMARGRPWNQLMTALWLTLTVRWSRADEAGYQGYGMRGAGFFSFLPTGRDAENFLSICLDHIDL